jgi:RNA polymerase sigma-70 factor, ECF subfamily
MSNNLRDHWDWSLIRKRCMLEAARIMRRPHDVEEVVQEALTRAWRARGTCRTPDAPIPWCLQITRNEAFRLIGRQRALSRGEPLDASHEIEDERAQVERERALTRTDVDRALGKLNPQDRLLISLRYEHDCSHPDIATKLQIPEATARVRLHRAHQRLKPLLESSS